MPLVFLLVLTLQAGSSSGTVPSVELRVTVGLGGWISPRDVTPLGLEVRAGLPLDGTLVVEVPSGVRGGGSVTHVLPLKLPAGSRQQAHLDIVVQDPRRPILVSIRDAGGERARHEVRIGGGRVVEGVVAALTREPAGLEFLSGTEGKRRPAYITEEDLPVRWQAYDAVDLLILRDLEPRVVLPAQERALVEWVAQGGRLLVVAPQRLNLAEAGWLKDLLPSRGRRTYGLGTVEVVAIDLFAPDRRARGALRTQVLGLLNGTERSGAEPTLASVLPSTRPLSAATQLAMAAVSLLYVLAVRLVLRRSGAARGGWIALAVLISGSTAALYTVAAGARSGATSVAQLSIAEMLGDLGQARVTTYASLIAPYGGRFALRLADGATARTLEDVPIAYHDGGREIRGSAPAGQVSFVARQIVALELRARLAGPDALVVDRGASALRGLVLYRQRQIYRLPPDLAGTIRLDPARWEPADRPGVVGADLAGRAMAILFAALDRSYNSTWLIGRVVDDRLGVRVAHGAPGEALRLAVVEVR